MSQPIARRVALRHLSVLAIGALAPAGLLACSKRVTCTDVGGLSSDEINMRNVIAAYSEPSMDAAKNCVLCAQYVPAAPNACGGCKVIKGPIHPEGSCKLFVAKPS